MTISATFFTDLDRVQAELETLRLQSVHDAEEKKFLRDEITWLKEQLAEIKRVRFGKKSERWVAPEQGALFDEVEMESKKPLSPEEQAMADEDQIDVPGYTRKRGHRKPLPEGLPREVIKIVLPADECFADDGTPLKVIGWEISEKLKYEPAKMSVIEYHRAKYGTCSGDYVKMAKPLPSIIPKGIPTPELLAAIIVSKYADGLPLYRMEEIFARHGIDINRGSMARWVVQVAMSCRPVWNILSDRLHDSPYVAVDETHTQVLKETGRKAESKSWMIVRSTPFGPKKVILFDYSVSRSSDVMKTLFAGYKGFLQCDELSAYDGLEKNEEIIRLGCNMHGRRRFEQAAVTGAAEGKSLGEEGLEYYKKIYDLEEEIREKPPDERHRHRQELALPIWREFKSWAILNRSKVPRRSKIGDAFFYFLENYEHLIAYLKDGRLECDNGFTERAIRKFAIGRNNWIFSDSVEGADASALLYSLVVTAKVNGVNPYWALVKLFREIPKAESLEDFELLAELILSPESQT